MVIARPYEVHVAFPFTFTNLRRYAHSPLPSECARLIKGLDLRTKGLLSFIMAGGLLVGAGAFTGTIANQPAQESLSLPSFSIARREEAGLRTPVSSSNCADVQFSLGMAKLHAADFEGALATLGDAETNYVKAEKVSDSHEFSAIQVKEQAQTNLWIAVALFQLGKTEEATTTLEAAIPQLTRVRSDASILVGIRDDAARSLQDAQAFLKRLKAAQ